MRITASVTLAADLAALFFICFLAPATAPQDRGHVQIEVNEQARRVDVTYDGKPFTSYIWPENLKKPVLYPLRTAKGTIITRGFPLEPRPGERTDHPHQVGLWLTYETVNGFDFWNNSEAIKGAGVLKMGTILHRKIEFARGGGNQANLAVAADWVAPGNRPILHEFTQFIFRGGATFRSIDRITILTALEKISFPDAKDGMLGMRVIRALGIPSDKPEVYTDANGRLTTVPKLDTTGVNGTYLTSEGKKGDAAWGTRGRWCNLSGMVGDEPVTISIFDHPDNPGFPTYWHARGYGLFAANPLGQKIFSNGKEELNFSLAPDASVTFRHRILISSAILTHEATEAAYKDFLSAYR